VHRARIAAGVVKPTSAPQDSELGLSSCALECVDPYEPVPLPERELEACMLEWAQRGLSIGPLAERHQLRFLQDFDLSFFQPDSISEGDLENASDGSSHSAGDDAQQDDADADEGELTGDYSLDFQLLRATPGPQLDWLAGVTRPSLPPLPPTRDFSRSARSLDSTDYETE
jgi:hypothetical protein